MGRTRLFHTVVIVGSGLLASCGHGEEQAVPPAAGSNVRPEHAAMPADAAMPVDAAIPVDAAVTPDAVLQPVDAGTPDASAAKKKPKPTPKPPPDWIRIMDVQAD